MSVSYVTKGSIQADTTGAGSIAVTMPDHAVNDILVVAAWCSMDYLPATATAPWDTQTIASQDIGAMRAIWFWKRATGTTGEGPTVTSTDTDLFTMPYVFRGCIETGTPYVDATIAYNGTAETTPDTATITTTGSDQFAVSFLSIEGDSTWNAGTNPPSGWTQVTRDVTSTGTDCGFNLMTQTKASAGDITAAAIGTYGESQEWASLTLAFVPAVPQVTSVTPSSTLSGSAKAGIVIAGKYFTGATGVTVGGHAATSVVVDSDIQITCTFPSHAAESSLDVIVTTASGSSTNDVHFAYVDPVSVTPALTDAMKTAASGVLFLVPSVVILRTVDDISIERKAGAGEYAEVYSGPWADGEWVDTGPFENGTTYYYRARRETGDEVV